MDGFRPAPYVYAHCVSPTRRSRATGRGPDTPATRALDRLGLSYVRHLYRHAPGAQSYGHEAAQALGVDLVRVFKTLLVDRGEGAAAVRPGEPAGARLAVAVVPVSGQLDLKAVADALGSKSVVMARPRDAERSTGYVVGGISPIGQKRSLPTVVDESAFDFTTIYVSGGRRGFDLELSPSDLEAVTTGARAAISRP